MQYNNHCTSPILQNRELPPLSTHLWLVSKTLNKAGQSNQDCHLWPELTSNLTRYILYTNETSTKFHTLLLNILHKFRTALKILTTYNEEKAKIEDTSSKDPNCKDIFNINVCRIHAYGYGLLRLSRGWTLKLHLKKIQSLLVDPLH